MENNSTGLISHCGLYCGDCFAYQGEIADMARDLRKKLHQAKFDRTASGLLSISKNSPIMTSVTAYWGQWCASVAAGRAEMATATLFAKSAPVVRKRKLKVAGYVTSLKPVRS